MKKGKKKRIFKEIEPVDKKNKKREAYETKSTLRKHPKKGDTISHQKMRKRKIWISVWESVVKTTKKNPRVVKTTKNRLPCGNEN